VRAVVALLWFAVAGRVELRVTVDVCWLV
jgi:hypothetical protein